MASSFPFSLPARRGWSDARLTKAQRKARKAAKQAEMHAAAMRQLAVAAQSR